MTEFLDGPAKGQMLSLRRGPVMLRVVVDARGNWDGLDQIDDEPKPGETVYAYVMVPGTEFRFHICARGRTHGGWYQGGHYKLYQPQPEPGHLRETRKWWDWCQANRVAIDAFRETIREVAA